MQNPHRAGPTAAREDFHAMVADELCDALVAATEGSISARKSNVPLDDGTRLDLLLSLDVDGKLADIAVETVRNAYPRDVQTAVRRLAQYALGGKEAGKAIPLVAAETLSPGARELLRKRGIGYFERNGNLYLRRAPWVINIQMPDRKAAKRGGGASLFTDAREMVVHALLMHRGEWLTGGELAEIAQTSQYTCSIVLQELEKLEWCESTGAGRTLRRRLTNARALLEAWVPRWKHRTDNRTRWHILADRPNLLLSGLTEKIDHAALAYPWAFTGTSAANVYAPLLTGTDTAEIIVPPGKAEEFAKALNLKRAEKGANVTLIERDGTSLQFRKEMPDFPAYLASPIILYLDLLDGRGRNKELAERVLEKLEI